MSAVAEFRKPSGFIGIDPGFTGGIAAIIGGAPMPALFDMPTIQYHVNRTRQGKRKEVTETELDNAKLLHIFRTLANQCGEIFAIVEKAQVRPATGPGGKGQGVVSQAKFYGQYTAICMALTACGIGYEVVASATWKCDMFRGQTHSADDDGPSAKEIARLKAIQLYPVLAERLALKKTHGLAEALLIATYAFRKVSAPF